MARLRPLGFLLLGLATLSTTRPLEAQQKYTVTDLGTLPKENATYANGINQAGHIVGFSYVQIENLNVPFPVLYERETALHNLGTLGGNGGGASAINNAGQIVGSSNITGDIARGTRNSPTNEHLIRSAGVSGLRQNILGLLCGLVGWAV